MAAAFDASIPGAWAPSSSIPERGLWSRLVAAGLHGGAGFLLATAALGVVVAQRVVHGGAYAVSPTDLATLDAVVPVAVMFGLVGVGHVVAALAIVVGSRAGTVIGFAVGVTDVAVGLMMAALAVGGARHRADGIGIATSVVVMGTVLAAAALVAHRKAFDTDGAAPA